MIDQVSRKNVTGQRLSTPVASGCIPVWSERPKENSCWRRRRIQYWTKL